MLQCSLFQTLIASRYGVSILGNSFIYDVSGDKTDATYPNEFISVTDEMPMFVRWQLY